MFGSLIFSGTSTLNSLSVSVMILSGTSKSSSKSTRSSASYCDKGWRKRDRNVAVQTIWCWSTCGFAWWLSGSLQILHGDSYSMTFSFFPPKFGTAQTTRPTMDLLMSRSVSSGFDLAGTPSNSSLPLLNIDIAHQHTSKKVTHTHIRIHRRIHSCVVFGLPATKIQ